MPKRFAIDTGLSGIVSGLHYPADRHSALQTLLILAPGAGASQYSEFKHCFTTGMATRGIDTVTFDFLYKVVGRRTPSRGSKQPTERLSKKHSWRPRLVIGGKSMGDALRLKLLPTPMWK